MPVLFSPANLVAVLALQARAAFLLVCVDQVSRLSVGGGISLGVDHCALGVPLREGLLGASVRVIEAERHPITGYHLEQQNSGCQRIGSSVQVMCLNH